VRVGYYVNVKTIVIHIFFYNDEGAVIFFSRVGGLAFSQKKRVGGLALLYWLVRGSYGVYLAFSSPC
jgi:hypothetical protein